MLRLSVFGFLIFEITPEREPPLYGKHYTVDAL